MNDASYDETLYDEMDDEQPAPLEAVSSDPPAPTYTEAPVSWTCKYDLAGFGCLFTIRGTSGKEVLDKANLAIAYLTSINAIPVSNGYGNSRAPSAPAVPAPAAAAPGLPAPAAAVQGPPSVPGAPAYVPIPGNQTQAPAAPEIIEVKTISHQVTPKGAHFVQVKGGRYMKWGVSAWPEVLPAVVGHYLEWPQGVEYPPPPEMRHAILDGKKVSQFTP